MDKGVSFCVMILSLSVSVISTRIKRHAHHTAMNTVTQYILSYPLSNLSTLCRLKRCAAYTNTLPMDLRGKFALYLILLFDTVSPLNYCIANLQYTDVLSV